MIFFKDVRFESLRLSIACWLVLVSFHVQQTHSSAVVLQVKNKFSDELFEICALKKSVPNVNDNEAEMPLINAQPYNGCSPYSSSSGPFQTLPKPSLNGSAVFIEAQNRFNCSFDVVVDNIQRANSRVAIIGSNGPIYINTTTTVFNISFLFMPQDFADRLTNFLSKSNSSSVVMKSIAEKFDFSLVVIWIIALANITLGAFWTNYEFAKSLRQTSQAPLNDEENKPSSLAPGFVSVQTANELHGPDQPVGPETPAGDSEANSEARALEDSSKTKNDKENAKHVTTLSVSYIAIGVLLVIVVSMLLLLYFFYNIMIYFIYTIFCIGAASSLYRIGSLFFDHCSILNCRIPRNNLPLLKAQPEYRKIILGSACLTSCALWFGFRHHPYAWIMQDIMAFSMALNALSFYRISTYKSIALLLSVFFLYDVFMVFLTPQITKGASIMEAVAFGGRDGYNSSGVQDWSRVQFGKRVDNSNRLPVVIVVPHLAYYKRLCNYYFDFPFSLLGLGDILIPGLSINYAIIYDLSSGNKYKPYFIVNLLAYLIGLMLALLGLIMMDMAQPALFYLCPLLILSSLATCLIRKEFKRYWNGTAIEEYTNSKRHRILQESKNTEDQ